MEGAKEMTKQENQVMQSLINACKEAEKWLFGDKRAIHITAMLKEALDIASRINRRVP